MKRKEKQGVWRPWMETNIAKGSGSAGRSSPADLPGKGADLI